MSERLAVLAALTALAGCAHAGRRQPPPLDAAPSSTQAASAEASPADLPPADAELEVLRAEARREAEATALARGEVVVAPARSEAPLRASSSGPLPTDAELEALRAEARREAEATAVARRRASAEAANRSGAPPGQAGGGATTGAGVVLKAWGYICLSHPFALAVCVVGFPVYGPFALAAVMVGALIGGSVGSASEAPPAGAPFAERRGRWAQELPQADGDPGGVQGGTGGTGARPP